jgi:hypothetical protein
MYYFDALFEIYYLSIKLIIVLSQKVLALYGDSMQALKKLVGKTTVVKDVRYGTAERNLLDVSSSRSFATCFITGFRIL